MKITSLIRLVLLAAAVVAVYVSLTKISHLEAENQRLKNNQELLLTENNAILAECNRYKVADSLNAYKIYELRLTVDEYKKYRSEDLALINKLKLDKSDMQKVIDSQVSTISSLTARLRDTIRIDNGKEIKYKVFEQISEWTDVSGCIDLQNDVVTLSITNRESLTIVESVEYKRFWGFLWKTNKVKNRGIDVVSKNPNTNIVNIDYINIEN